MVSFFNECLFDILLHLFNSVHLPQDAAHHGRKAFLQMVIVAHYMGEEALAGLIVHLQSTMATHLEVVVSCFLVSLFH